MRRPGLFLVVLTLPLVAAICGKSIKYHGSGANTSSRSYACDGGSKLHVLVKGESGVVTIEVDDESSGDTLFSTPYAPSAVEFSQEYEFPAQQTSPSRWLLRGETNADWKGRYEAVVDCL